MELYLQYVQAEFRRNLVHMFEDMNRIKYIRDSVFNHEVAVCHIEKWIDDFHVDEYLPHGIHYDLSRISKQTSCVISFLGLSSSCYTLSIQSSVLSAFISSLLVGILAEPCSFAIVDPAFSMSELKSLFIKLQIAKFKHTYLSDICARIQNGIKVSFIFDVVSFLKIVFIYSLESLHRMVCMTTWIHIFFN